MEIQKKSEEAKTKLNLGHAHFKAAFLLSPWQRTRKKSGFFIASAWVLTIGILALLAAATSDQKQMFLEQPQKIVVTIFLLQVFMSFTLVYLTTSFRRDMAAFLGPEGFFRRFRFSKSVSVASMTSFFVAFYLLYAVVTGAFSWQAFLKLTAFVALPLILCYRAQLQSKSPTLYDGLAVLSLWLPFNFGFMASIWTWPEGEAAYVLNTPLAMAVALLCYLSIRKFSFIKFRFKFTLNHFKQVLIYLGLFMAIALPVGLSTGFLAINPRLEPAKLMAPLGIFFFIALPEELLFRGVVLGMLRQTFETRGMEKKASDLLSLVLSSCLFGVSHWHDFGPPPLTYIGLASLAGIFYGLTYMKTGALTSAVILHTLVDTLWEWFFHA